MGEPLVRNTRLSFEQYLELELRSTDARHEFVAGQMFAMTGGTLRHNLATGNVFAALYEPADAAGCRLYSSDAKLRIGDNAYYPDVMVVCGDSEPPHEQFEMAPCLVVEVLSPSSRSVDTREKYEAYTRLPSMLAYLVVDTDKLTVDCHVKREEWISFSLFKEGDEVQLVCPELSLRWDQVFRRFPEL